MDLRGRREWLGPPLFLHASLVEPDNGLVKEMENKGCVAKTRKKRN
jgi:hypothetical protein